MRVTGIAIACLTVAVLVTIRVTESTSPGISGELIGTDTVSCGPRTMPSWLSSTPTLAAVVTCWICRPSTVTVTAFGVVSDIDSPARPSGRSRETDSAAASSRSPSSVSACCTLSAVVQ